MVLKAPLTGLAPRQSSLARCPHCGALTVVPSLWCPRCGALAVVPSNSVLFPRTAYCSLELRIVPSNCVLFPRQRILATQAVCSVSLLITGDWQVQFEDRTGHAPRRGNILTYFSISLSVYLIRSSLNLVLRSSSRLSQSLVTYCSHLPLSALRSLRCETALLPVSPAIRQLSLGSHITERCVCR